MSENNDFPDITKCGYCGAGLVFNGEKLICPLEKYHTLPGVLPEPKCDICHTKLILDGTDLVCPLEKYHETIVAFCKKKQDEQEPILTPEYVQSLWDNIKPDPKCKTCHGTGSLDGDPFPVTCYCITRQMIEWQKASFKLHGIKTHGIYTNEDNVVPVPMTDIERTKMDVAHYEIMAHDAYNRIHDASDKIEQIERELTAERETSNLLNEINQRLSKQLDITKAELDDVKKTLEGETNER